MGGNAKVNSWVGGPLLAEEYPQHYPSPGSSASPPSLGAVANLGQDQHTHSLSQFSTPPAVKSDAILMVDIQSTSPPDGSSESRKRCASTNNGDRVNKAAKMEPQDDLLLHSSLSDGSLPLLQPAQIFQPAVVALPATAIVPPYALSTPPSQPSSRPQSSAGLPTHPSFMHQQLPTSLSYPSLTTLSETVPATTFEATSPILSAPPGTDPFSSPSVVRASWSESPLTFSTRQHHHTSSGSSLNGGLNIGGMGSLGTSISPFTSPGTFGSPSQVRVPSSSSISPPIGRVSRSGSLTGPPNPFAFGFPEVNSLESITHSSRPSTSVSTAHSPEETSDDDDDYEHDSPPGRKGGSMHGIFGNRTHAGLGPGHHSMDSIGERSGGHGNEVPQEYRAEVDRIFFEFLNKVCSNRKFPFIPI